MQIATLHKELKEKRESNIPLNVDADLSKKVQLLEIQMVDKVEKESQRLSMETEARFRAVKEEMKLEAAPRMSTREIEGLEHSLENLRIQLEKANEQIRQLQLRQEFAKNKENVEGSSCLVLKYLQLQSQQAGLKSVYERQSLYQEKRFLQTNAKIFNLEKLIGDLHEAVRNYSHYRGGEMLVSGDQRGFTEGDKLQQKLELFMQSFEAKTLTELKEFASQKLGGTFYRQLDSLQHRVKYNEEKLNTLATSTSSALQTANYAKSQIEMLRSMPERDAGEVWREIGAIKIDLSKNQDNFLQLRKLVDLQHQALNRKTSDILEKMRSPLKSPAKLSKIGSSPHFPDSGALQLEMLQSGALHKFEPSPNRRLIESLKERGYKY